MSEYVFDPPVGTNAEGMTVNSFYKRAVSEPPSLVLRAAFQRNMVWRDDQRAFLVDSIAVFASMRDAPVLQPRGVTSRPGIIFSARSSAQPPSHAEVVKFSLSAYGTGPSGGSPAKMLKMLSTPVHRPLQPPSFPPQPPKLRGLQGYRHPHAPAVHGQSVGSQSGMQNFGQNIVAKGR